MKNQVQLSRPPLRRGFLLIPVALACFGLSPAARAVDPAPDGGYPGNTTAEGDSALFSLTTGTNNTALGFHALFNVTTGYSNTATGQSALFSTTTGNSNVAIGDNALFNNTVGTNNTAIGTSVLSNTTTGQFNTAIGSFAMLSNTTGNRNIAIGLGAGANNLSGNDNITISSSPGGGPALGSGRISIGTQGTQTATFIAGIAGIPVSGTPVGITSAGQLGIAPSSERFKDAIKPMDKASEAILALQPVTFRYKHELDPKGIPQFGLVAEQVEKVNPALVARDDQGKAFTVRYEAVNAMLLNEFLKEHRTVQELKSTAAKQEATIAKQQKQIEALTTGLQKVSNELELSKPAPRTVDNHQ
jgi:uncharacterized coiled-coil protein SlyX